MLFVNLCPFALQLALILIYQHPSAIPQQGIFGQTNKASDFE